MSYCNLRSSRPASCSGASASTEIYGDDAISTRDRGLRHQRMADLAFASRVTQSFVISTEVEKSFALISSLRSPEERCLDNARHDKDVGAGLYLPAALEKPH
jgi:hypothetical protein